MVARLVVANRRRSKFAGDERRDEGATRLVVMRDQSDGEARAGFFAVEIHSERSDRPAAAAGLLGVEEAEEKPAACGRVREGERAGCAELLIEGCRRQLHRIHRRASSA